MIFQDFQFYRNIFRNACEISLEKVIRLYNGQIRQTIHYNTRMLMSAFLIDIFQQNFKVQKSVFVKYVIVT